MKALNRKILPLIAKPVTIKDGRKKLILNAGEHVEIITGGEHDEGYSYTTSVYERHENTIIVNIYTESRDCDGPISSHQELEADIMEMRKNRPQWKETHFRQNDRFAQAMGY